jgi:hypothetical protein
MDHVHMAIWEWTTAHSHMSVVGKKLSLTVVARVRAGRTSHLKLFVRGSNWTKPDDLVIDLGCAAGDALSYRMRSTHLMFSNHFFM